MFDFLIWDLGITCDEIFYHAIRAAKSPKKYNEKKIDFIIDDYEKHRALQRIFERMGELKYDKINWERGHKDGIFCLVDYFRFPKLKDFKEEGICNYFKNCGDEEYGRKAIKKLRKKYESKNC